LGSQDSIFKLSAQEKTDDVAAAIVRLEQQWAGAQKTGHAAVVAPLLAEDFINTDVDGKVAGKAQWLSHFKAAHGEQNEISDVKVMVYGNTAMATWRLDRERGGERRLQS